MSGTDSIFTVVFNGVEVFTADNDIQAVTVALNLHQVSNVVHTVNVVSCDDVILSLKRS